MTMMMMCLDLFSFSIVIAMAGCDLQLTLSQKSLLVSIPFMGPVIMAYAWGYICDTQGRRRSLLIAMSVSFIMSSLCAFAPEWKTLAILKLIGTCFVSCAQSGSSTLLGESCPERVKGTYLFIMNSTVHLCSGLYFVIGYFVSDLNFYDLGYITFVPWHLLILIFALPLGLCALTLYFFYESFKFLLNAGRRDEALYVLSQIYGRNGGKDSFKIIQKLGFDPNRNFGRTFGNGLLTSCFVKRVTAVCMSGCHSSQKPSLQVQSLTPSSLKVSVFAATSRRLQILLPKLSHAGLMDPPIMIACVTYGIIACCLNLLLSRLALFKKALTMSILTVTALSTLATLLPFSETNYFYFATFTTSTLMGPMSVYFVELYPTSFRAMAGCLGVMVARLSSVVGINVVGPLIMAHCTYTYGIAAVLLSGTLMSLLLPSDKKPNKA